nr:hypothetical protein [Tanacetum cinerariifolium]
MSADSAVTYSFIHSEARFWSIPSKDPYEVAAQQLFEQVRESSAAAARQQGPAMAHRVDCSYMETRLQDTERRMMAALELVNWRVSYQVDVCTRESSELCTRHHDAQKDRAAAADDFSIEHIMRTQALETGAHIDTLEDTGSGS